MDHCDILLIIPLQEEFEVLKTHFTVTYIDKQNTIYYYAVTTNPSNYKIFCLVLGKTGPTNAASVVTQAIFQCRPKLVILLGIGGALDKDLLLGDAVIGTEIDEFLVNAKAAQEKDAYAFQFSGRYWRVKEIWASFINNFPNTSAEVFQAWKEVVRIYRASLKFTKKQQKLIHSVPNLAPGLIASGDVVGASYSFAAELLGINRKFRVIEMEAAGVSTACEKAEEVVDYLVIRGISDFSDERKSELDKVRSGAFRKLAMTSATLLFSYLIQSADFQTILPPSNAAPVFPQSHPPSPVADPSNHLPSASVLTSGMSSDLITRWWTNRGYECNPFQWVAAQEIPEDHADRLSHFYVDPLSNRPLGNGNFLLLDRLESRGSKRPVIAYASMGSGKTFYCVLAVKELEHPGQDQYVVHIRNLNSVNDLPHLTATSIASKVYEKVCEKFAIDPEQDPGYNLAGWFEALAKVCGSRFAPHSKEPLVYIFIDDVETLFEEREGYSAQNRAALNALIDFCRMAAQRGGSDPFTFRIFIPIQLRAEIKKGLGQRYSANVDDAQELSWNREACMAVIEKRLENFYQKEPHSPSNTPNRLMALLADETLDAINTWLDFRTRVSPRCLISLFDQLTRYASAYIAGEERIPLKMWNSFLSLPKSADFCPPDFPISITAQPTISVSNHLSLPFKGRIDFAIITIREDEFEAVLERFVPEPGYPGDRRYIMSRVNLEGKDYYRVAIARSTDQGGGPAQDLARDMIEHLSPEWLLVVGIAGGVPDDDFTLGDVVIAKRLLDFSVKATYEGNQAEYDVRGWSHPLVEQVCAALPATRKQLEGKWNRPKSIGVQRPTVQLDQADRFYGDEVWKHKVKNSLERHFKTTRLPRFTTVVTAATEELVKSPSLVQLWMQDARGIRSVEMELAGVYQAARRAEHQYPVLAIRGISDIVGFKREPNWTTYACHTAAAFTYTLLKSGFIKRSIASQLGGSLE